MFKMSDNENIFLTQNKFSQESALPRDISDLILDMEEAPPSGTFKINTDIFSDISEFESGDDEALIQATQEAEHCFVEKQRFGPCMSECDVEKMMASAIPQNTQNKSKWAVNVFESWREERNKHASKKFLNNLINMDDLELCEALSFFIGEVRNRSGAEYQPKTIYELIVSIQHNLRSAGRFINFLEDPHFDTMRRVLDAKMKALTQIGMGIKTKQADIISTAQEDILWEKGFLGTDSPQKLIDSLVYGLGLNFALRAGQEHRNLRFGQSSQITLVSTGGAGGRYLLYKEDISKTNSGGLKHRKVEQKTTRAHENFKCPERCIVSMYEKYLSKRPVGGKSTAFYLRPKRKFTESVWFDDVPIGVHSLQTTIGRLCKEAGFLGHYTNHSLRATAATRLYAAGIDEQLITEKTGHRSTAVRTYKRTSDEQQEEVSNILQTSKLLKKEEGDVKGESGCRELSMSCEGISIQLKF